MGRKAAVGVFINVCQRHRFERETLPEAEAKGWPKSIEWSLIHQRVMRMKDHLEALVENSLLGSKPSVEDTDDDGNIDWEIPGQSQKGKGKEKQKSPQYARDKCIFWEEVIEEVKEKGTRVAANVKSQFANFQKTQPG